MANKGWIKIDRSLMDHEIWRSTEPFDIRSAWVDMLMMANYADHDFFSKGRAVHLEPGQFITSERSHMPPIIATKYIIGLINSFSGFLSLFIFFSLNFNMQNKPYLIRQKVIKLHIF